MTQIPFYITPNEFRSLQVEQEKQITNEVGVMSWCSYNLDDKNRWLRKTIWFTTASIVTLLLVGVGLLADYESFTYVSPLVWVYIVSLSLGLFATYISYAVDDRFEYELSQQGIIIKQCFGEPLWVPVAVKAIGVIGSVASLFFLTVMGPVALVGVGGFMLVSFTLLKRKPHEATKQVVPSDKFICARYNRKRGIICIFSRSDVCEPSTKYDDSVFRVLSKSWLYIFPGSGERFDKILNLIDKDLALECEETPDVSVMFDWQKAPQEFKAFRHQREHYSMEDAVTKRDHPAPPPKKPR
ncbi:hypothetical protein ACK1CN_18465 [Vibrio coralliilyticus]|uniref:hypothetical protein n=1 Tax=Vibrio coralliilyticus TaxID=190893 RepID=UPI0015602371|nr:hypothetical protein [Vibrio coralliilyticus]NRF64043.1 hypothetical protein [Vibrio coralliilyticus]